MAKENLKPTDLLGEAANWSLASDARLLEALQQISRQLCQQTKDVQKKLDNLAETVASTETRQDTMTSLWLISK